MKKTAGKCPAICGGLFLTLVSLGAACCAQSPGQEQPLAGAARAAAAEPGPEAQQAAATAWGLRNSREDGDAFTESRLGLSLLKNMALDEKDIWTSPAHLRLGDADWIVPSAGIAAASLAADTRLSAGLARSTGLAGKSNNIANSGLAAFAGISGGLYLLGKMKADAHRQEAGILSGEAAINAVGATTALQYAFGRQRPGGSSAGEFWRQGTSFPSDHATAAWAAASVIAHEYPGPLTKLFLYGLASAVSVSRVTGERHFPTDVLVGSAIGWLIGQRVYRAHHDPELGGGSWQTFSEARAEQGGRNFSNAGSPHVPLDSWIYPAIDRLIALGYIPSAFQDVRPLTRTECAELVQEAGETLAGAPADHGEADTLYAALQREFQDEFSVLEGEGKERSVQLESLYAGVTAIGGPPLNDSYHFGQTIIDNFGRPYERGFNTYDGFSGYATTGRYAIHVRGEFQAAPSGPAYPAAARQAIAAADQIPLPPAAPVPAVKQFRLLESYISADWGGWDFSVGKQSLWWGRGVGGALILSDNAEPLCMFRARPMQAVVLPSFLGWLGPMKGDFFFAKLSGNEYPPRPLLHGLKLTAKRTRYIEASFLATAEMGGVGRPLTLGALFNSFFSAKSSDLYSPSRSPGKRTIGADFSYAIPHLRDRLQIYANGLLPEDNPTSLDMSTSPIYIWRRLAVLSGIYLPRLPRLPKLDFRFESVYTDPPTDRSRYGQYIYFNNFYRDLDTNKKNLIGDWVGREGMGYQAWSRYWLGARNSIQFSYRHASVAGDFIPGGETMNDGSVQIHWLLQPELSLSASFQYERWRAPILAPAVQSNLTSAVEIRFTPGRRGR